MTRTTLMLCATLSVLAAAVLQPAEPLREGQNVQALDELSASFERIAERVSPSVVQIFTSGYPVLPVCGFRHPQHAGSGSDGPLLSLNNAVRTHT